MLWALTSVSFILLVLLATSSSSSSSFHSSSPPAILFSSERFSVSRHRRLVHHVAEVFSVYLLHSVIKQLHVFCNKCGFTTKEKKSGWNEVKRICGDGIGGEMKISISRRIKKVVSCWLDPLSSANNCERIWWLEYNWWFTRNRLMNKCCVGYFLLAMLLQ